MKIKRKWKAIFFMVVLGLLALLIYKGVLFVGDKITTYRLEKLGFSELATENIKINDQSKYIIENEYYSVVLEDAFEIDSFEKENIDLYLTISYKDGYDNVSAINNLVDLGYGKDDVISIFNNLDSDDIDAVVGLGYKEYLVSMLEYDYYIMDNYSRYEDYMSKNDYSLEDIITYVNIGLDYDFYTHITEIEDPDSLLVLCNKYNKLPSDYEPEDLVKIDSAYSNATRYLRKEAYDAFISMADKIESLGMHIYATSAYRSYSYQENLYSNYVASDGVSEADTYSARAGHSEHQTGLAIDIASNDGSWYWFQFTDEYEWIEEHAHEYGFIIRYDGDKTDITGYTGESWHIRYVGIDAATYIYENDMTFDEYYVRFVQ